MVDDKLFARIAPLFDVGAFANLNVLIAGCGSGGGQVALQLVMSGVRNFTLIDNDILEIENVIRHICGLRYLGQKKTDAVADVLLDRNPAACIRKINEDIMVWSELEDAVREADLVIFATDNEPTRYLLNDICVRTKTPFVVGRVFTRGIGGEVFTYNPEGGGCLACLEHTLERTQFRDGVKEIDLVSDEEREQVYGLEPKEIKDSPGLSVDIGFITSFHTRFALDALAELAPSRPKFLTPLTVNYLVFGNRAIHPFTKNFEIQRIKLHPRDGCMVCNNED